jgi:hypothetical protein
MLVGYGGIRAPIRVQVIPDQKLNRFRGVRDGKLLDQYSDFFMYDQELEKEFHDVVERYEKLLQEWRDLRDRMKHIRARDVAKQQGG